MVKQIPPLSVQIWSDIACPWCWIGKRGFETAAARFDRPIDIRWRAFELNPEAPRQAPESVDYAQRLASKYQISVAEGQQFVDRMVAAGAARGLDIRFDRIRPSNTFDAHRLLAWSVEYGQQTELKERLFTAYLHEGQAMSDHDALIGAVTAVDLPVPEAIAVLNSDRFEREVRSDEANARTLGITGVPTFVFGEQRLAVSGAQPPEALLEIMHKAAS